MDNFWTELFKIIIGDYTLIQLVGYIWFFIIGYVFYTLNEISNRDVQSVNTPVAWSWKFWFHDNWRRYLVTILATYIMFRFYVEFVGHDFTNMEALMMGLIGDGVGASIKKKILAVSADRKKLLEEASANENQG